jgi:D-glycero-D-manno-heptose 1,7-bisphosphate phosphatase
MKLSKIAFLDRDGVINSSGPNNGYVGSLKHFKWVQGAIKAIKYLNDKNYKVVVVTNQSGVARGFFRIKDIKTIHSYIQKKLKENEAKIDKFYFCPFHKDGIVKKYKKNSSLRKPNIGMFRLAQKKYKIDKKNSFMIGDQKTDMQFAKKAKINGYLFNEKNLYKFVKFFFLQNICSNHKKSVF